MLKRILVAASFVPLFATAQVTYQKQSFTITGVTIFEPRKAQNDFSVELNNLEKPTPGGADYRSFLNSQKVKSSEKYPRKTGAAQNYKTNSLDPIVGQGRRITQKSLPKWVDFVGGIPNDNTLAVSNDGTVLAAGNSSLWAYNSVGDTAIFPAGIMSLKSFGGGGFSDGDFDPKLIYDEKEDRFILVYLINSTPNKSAFRIAISSTNNPLDPWYQYGVTGNPLNTNRWTDFPSISITDSHIYLTGNLVVPNVSWQLGFDGSLIWQLDKKACYAGLTQVNTVLWSDIKYENRFIRNLHPVCGAASALIETPTFLSNRNFDVTNDTIFILQLIEINGQKELDIKVRTTNVAYGVPPNGRQQDTDLNDPTSGLQTNDARILGAISNGSWIQFVANTINPATGFCGIYHGFIVDMATDPKITGHIIGHPTRDFGYPNIAYTGNEDCDIETMIGFNYASPTDFPGVSAVYFANDSSYSNQMVLKEGENYTNRHAEDQERWGDYFGLQRKYNAPGTVWASGYFGNLQNRNVTYVSQLFSADTIKIVMQIAQSGNALFCTGAVTANVYGGVAPYHFTFDGVDFGSNNTIANLCEAKTILVQVTDARGCTKTDSVVFTKPVANALPALFPNPVGERFVAQFILEEAQNLEISIVNEKGQLVHVLLNQAANSGLNELLFNTFPLSKGNYTLRILGDKGFEFTEKFVKAL